MKERVNQATTQDTRPKENAAWYQALPLIERIGSLHPSINVPLSTPPPDLELARQRVQRWKDQGAFKQEGHFAQRLANDGLTEDDLLTLLAEPAETIHARISPLPAWLVELQTAFADQDANNTEFVLPLIDRGFDPHHLAFLNLIKPLLQRGTLRLQAGIQLLTQRYTQTPFDPDTLLPLLFTSVIKQLLTRLVRTAVLELNVARIQEHLAGATPEDRFQDFVRQLVQYDGIPPLLEEYMVLTRSLVETIDSWVARELELLERLCHDWEHILQTFTPEQAPGQLTGVYEGAGDTHRGGRSVTILVWSSGFRLLYKPRPMAIDIHFQELLNWLNQQGQQPPLRTFSILNQGTYGWTEFLYVAACTSKEEVERFYQRQGSYLALLYALEAVDFHAENLLAVGEHPMLVDLESLFHPRVSLPDKEKHDTLGMDTIGHSVIRVGLLPQRIWAGADGIGVDVSGLGGQRGQLNPTPVAKWTEIGTDQMRITRERMELAIGSHRPMLNGQDINTLEYCDNIITGFAATYRLLIQQRDTLQEQILPRFTHDEIRCLLRPTKVYGTLLTDAFHPNVLRDALDRDRLFDRLWLSVPHQPYLACVIKAEQSELRQGDIPMFTSYADSLDLISGEGEKTAAFFEESGLDLVRKRLQQLSKEDLEKQIWVIQASFTSMILGTDGATHGTLHLHPSQTIPTSARFLTAAQSVGDRLNKLALTSEDAIGWLGITSVGEREWHLLAAEEDLYSGTSGIALFFAYLGQITAEERYTTLARSALATVRHQVKRKKDYPLFGGISLFSGLGSFIYLLSHLGTLWQKPELYQEAEEAVKQLPNAIVHEKGFDVIGGSAGCISALLSLFAVAPSDILLNTAMQCGDHLLACAQPMEKGIGWKGMREVDPPLMGLAHGNAGIALNLLRLFEVSQEERFKRGALEAMEYERSMFSEEMQNWPDLRVNISEKTTLDTSATSGAPSEQKYMTAWCHGAPGIGLARLASLKILDNDAATRKEVDIAIETTLRGGFGLNHSLCHGDLGNLELLLAAVQVLNLPEHQEQVDHLSAMLLDTIDTQGWVTGVPLGVETPGLMVGLAGIGYALLRLAAPTKVPSVLLGAPPYKK